MCRKHKLENYINYIFFVYTNIFALKTCFRFYLSTFLPCIILVSIGVWLCEGRNTRREAFSEPPAWVLELQKQHKAAQETKK